MKNNVILLICTLRNYKLSFICICIIHLSFFMFLFSMVGVWFKMHTIPWNTAKQTQYGYKTIPHTKYDVISIPYHLIPHIKLELNLESRACHSNISSICGSLFNTLFKSRAKMLLGAHNEVDSAKLC